LHFYNGARCTACVRCTVRRGRSAPLRGAQINEVKERIAMKEGELIDIEAEFAVPHHTPQPHRLARATRALALA
jgi:hypothetical protein